MTPRPIAGSITGTIVGTPVAPNFGAEDQASAVALTISSFRSRSLPWSLAISI